MRQMCLYPDLQKNARRRLRQSGRVFCVLGAAVLAGLFLTGCKDKPAELKSDSIVLQQRLRARIQTLDPADVRDTTGTCVASDIFETLYDYHYLKRPYQLIPILAADMPCISGDGKTYTIPLRNDVYFHDDACFPDGRGRLLTAHDFVYAWKRIADVKTRSVSWWIFDRRIAGLDEFREYSKTCEKDKVDYSRPVEGLQAVDDFTLQVKLNSPWPQFVYWLAYIATAPMAREAVDYYKQEIGFHPVGTGPFKVDRWESGAYVEASRHRRYHSDPYPDSGEAGDAEAGFLADAGKPLPFADKVVWRIVTEDQPRWRLFLKGLIDLTSIPKDNFGQVFTSGLNMSRQMTERNIRMTTFDEPSTFWIAFNMNDPVLKNNKPLRQALSHSIDRKRFIDVFFDGRGHEAFGFIPPVMPGYDPNIVSISNSQYDLAAATQYLQEAEKISGGKIPRMRLAIGGLDSTNRQICQYMQRCIGAIGLETEIELFDWPTFLEKLRKGDHQLMILGWTADYPDVESFLQLFYSKNIPYPNEFAYASPEFDAIFERASTMPDCPERTALYQQAQRIVNNDVPCAYTFHRVNFIMSHAWLGNVKANAYKNEMAGWGMSKYYRIDPQKRDEYKKKFR
jgi:ABC-type oligopeptide transport system substrate-binding subunit